MEQGREVWKAAFPSKPEKKCFGGRYKYLSKEKMYPAELVLFLPRNPVFTVVKWMIHRRNL